MIAIIAGDKVALSTEGLDQHLEKSISVIDPDLSFEYVHDAHRGFAEDAARDFNQTQVERIEDELRQGRQILEAKERLTRKKEFSLWKQSLNATAAEIRKRVKLVQFFGDFSVEKIIAIAKTVNIYGLCAPKFTVLIEKLKELPVLAADIIRQMVKEARPPRAPKQQESSVEWQRNDEGGGRHLSINLHNDELGVEIKTSAKEQQITEQEAIAQAFRKSKLVDRAVQERSEAIAQIRDKHVKMQREIIAQREQLQQKDERIGYLELQLDALKTENTASSPKIEDDIRQEPSNTGENLLSWEEFAISVNGDHETLLRTVKDWSDKEKQHLVMLLSQHIEANYPEVLTEFDWIPYKLRNAALQKISFAVQKIVGADNLVDEPELKTFYGCIFISLRDFGTRQERWLFQAKDGKQLPCFGREEFSVERF